jgi:hypothetical protein
VTLTQASGALACTFVLGLFMASVRNVSPPSATSIIAAVLVAFTIGIWVRDTFGERSYAPVQFTVLLLVMVLALYAVLSAVFSAELTP